MNKNCKRTLGATLLLTTAFSVTEGWTQTCAIPPTCESLGYTMSEADCEGAVIKCPFDTTKVYCPKLAQDGSGDYPCSSKYYLQLKPNTSLNNINCTTLSPPMSISTSTSNLVCSATQSAPVGVSTQKAYSTKNECLSATQYANEQRIAGCCDDEGRITVFAPPMLNYANFFPTYRLANDYYVDGAVVGTVITLDSDSSGTIATLVGMATKTEASTICANYKVGGLNWTLTSGYNACILGLYKSDLRIGTNGIWVMTTSGYGPCSVTHDLNDASNLCSMNPDFNSQCKEDALHQVVCQASF